MDLDTKNDGSLDTGIFAFGEANSTMASLFSAPLLFSGLERTESQQLKRQQTSTNDPDTPKVRYFYLFLPRKEESRPSVYPKPFMAWVNQNIPSEGSQF